MIHLFFNELVFMQKMTNKITLNCWPFYCHFSVKWRSVHFRRNLNKMIVSVLIISVDIQFSLDADKMCSLDGGQHSSNLMIFTFDHIFNSRTWRLSRSTWFLEWRRASEHLWIFGRRRSAQLWSCVLQMAFDHSFRNALEKVNPPQSITQFHSKSITEILWWVV